MQDNNTTQNALNNFRASFPGTSYVIGSERAPGTLTEVHTATVTYGRIVESATGASQIEALETAFDKVRRQF